MSLIPPENKQRALWGFVLTFLYEKSEKVKSSYAPTISSKFRLISSIMLIILRVSSKLSLNY